VTATAAADFVAAQYEGRAVHPSYVEGQIQGGIVRGIGWALNEEYTYGRAGRLANAGFLDYRIPVASDLPMIDTALVRTADVVAEGASRARHWANSTRAWASAWRRRTPSLVQVENG
jgi:CO/xanthine dehydrogenase Mo-binding subunit